MNRWKTKKKARDAESGVRSPSIDSDAPPVPVLKSSKTFLFGRKNSEPEPKPQIDLEHALPSSDDFRTSLLMSGLSARFSMLREQDDPKSKIGKASDDSVLFPKRQSRMNDFGFSSHGLSDIAEVSSIHSSVRPPFTYSKTDSYHEFHGLDDDGGNIMDRKKPTDGNNLFGGRQKIYKIANHAASTRTLNETSTNGGMGGRALYDDDVSLSAFQKLREREKQEQQQRELELGNQVDEVPSRSTSPTLTGYNRNRETSSTTTTGSITRSSTAATSVTSQRTPSQNSGINPVLAKTRRLYETGLDQHLHEQQNSAISRIDSLTRQRNLGVQTPPLGLTSPIMGGDRWDRHPMAGKQSMPNLRAASPTTTITPIGTFDFGVKPINTSPPKPWGGASPPLSPPTSDFGDNSNPILPVEPNDVGKATASGAFNKPTQAYDDTKYAERQLQLQQERESTESPPLKDSPPRGLPRSPRPVPPQQPYRSRGESNVTMSSDRSRSNSSAVRRFQDLASVHHESVPEHSVAPSTTFFESPSNSPRISPNVQQEPMRSHVPPLDFSRLQSVPEIITTQRSPESQHPANRTDTVDPTVVSPLLTTPTSGQLVESPTLGTTSGLSNIRQHLRTDSNSSSIYSNVPSAGIISKFPEQAAHKAQADQPYVDRSWEHVGWDPRTAKQASSMPPAGGLPSLPSGSKSSKSQSDRSEDERPSWEQELDGQHNRTGSSATQKEQQEFQDELAARRRQIKENMKSFVESESRSSSPVPGGDSTRDFNPMRHPALSMLKSKTSRGSLAGKPGKESGQNKAMKMLGLNTSSSMDAEQDPRNAYDSNAWRSEEEDMLRGGPRPAENNPQTKAFRQARRDAQRDRERQLAERHQPVGRGPQEMSSGQRMIGKERFPPNIRTGPRDPSRDRKQPPVAYTPREDGGRDARSRAPSRTSRDRSGSDASGRSKSRNGRYRDDLAQAMAEGISSSSKGYDDLNVPNTRLTAKSPGASSNFQPSPIPSPMIATPRSRSNSVMTPNGYFEPSQQYANLQPTLSVEHMTPRPSPAFSVNPTPSLARPSPVPSATNTPTFPTFQAPSQAKLPVVAARKRSINKSDISEPTLISSTSRINTVNLPPGSSLQNGQEPQSAPPIPPVNPRRRQTRTMFGFSKKDEVDDNLHSLPMATQSTEEMSTFSADETEKPRAKERQKLRKSSSEGGALSVRARQAAFASPGPSLPASPYPPGVNRSPPKPTVEGEMF